MHLEDQMIKIADYSKIIRRLVDAYKAKK